MRFPDDRSPLNSVELRPIAWFLCERETISLEALPHWVCVNWAWGFLYLKIEKFVGFATFTFHVFDRYEIHIQDVFVDFI